MSHRITVVSVAARPARPVRPVDRAERRRSSALRRSLTGAFVVALVALAGCAEKEETVLVDRSGLATKVDTSVALSPLLYPDGQLTLNDRCPVRKVGLNPRMPAIYVNQHPVGYC